MNKFTPIKYIAYFLLIVMWVCLLSGTFMTYAKAGHLINNNKEEVIEVSFEDIHNEVKTIFTQVTGRLVTTQHVEIGNWPGGSNVLAYCRPSDPTGSFPKYITFNHDLLDTYDYDMTFQVILHEYVHCEYNVGHQQIPGNFMNDGGNPELDKETTVEQFKLWHEYYIKLYALYLTNQVKG